MWLANPTLTVVRAGSQESVQLPNPRLPEPVGQLQVAESRLGLAPAVVGTSPECDLVTQDPAVSRAHCSLQLTSQGLLLKDLGSKNGTFVGQARVREVFLPVGVRAVLGGCELWVETTGASTAVAMSPKARFGGVVGASVVMRTLFALLERLARQEAPVLLEGESGTGKELAARALHDAARARARPFEVVDCGGLPPTLIESELFGHERGAFTGADRATARAPSSAPTAARCSSTSSASCRSSSSPSSSARSESAEIRRVGGKRDRGDRRARRRRHQPRPPPRGQRRAVPRRPLLPPGRHPAPHAAAARARRHAPPRAAAPRGRDRRATPARRSSPPRGAPRRPRLARQRARAAQRSHPPGHSAGGGRSAAQANASERCPLVRATAHRSADGGGGRLRTAVRGRRRSLPTTATSPPPPRRWASRDRSSTACSGATGTRMNMRPEERLGPYRMLEQLDRGGMAEIWLADSDAARWR